MPWRRATRGAPAGHPAQPAAAPTRGPGARAIIAALSCKTPSSSACGSPACFLGAAIAWGKGPSFVVWAVAVVPSLFWRAAAEERLLRATFGAEFDGYRARTRLILPGML